MVVLYDLFILLLRLGLRLAAIRYPKAKAGIQGRKHLFAALEKLHTGGKPLVWVHSASTGEFEQAKPLIEAIRQAYPGHVVLGTFFSPSGYEAAHNYPGLDFKYYLPFDTARNAQKFIAAVRPSLVIFSKYDFWYHHLTTVNKAGIPLLLISAIFRPAQPFFKWYGGFHRTMLRRFRHLFVQDDTSLQLLRSHGIGQCSISGDTRFDRVLAIRQNGASIPLVAQFAANSPVLVAGSTWPGDEQLLQQIAVKIKMVIAPHEINAEHIEALQKAFPQAVLFSEAAGAPHLLQSAPVLIIDNIGMLSRLYRYAALTYVGGGFTPSGIHNTLEAAVWGKPVIFGPTHQKFREAQGLIDAGAGFSIATAPELNQTVQHLLHNKAALEAASIAAEQYVAQNTGATGRILQYIQENRLLTR